MTVEKYNEMFAEQKGCCLICERHQSEFVNRLAVDHNHDNNAIRGLLCHHCNTALSRFEDNPERLRKAAEYLETRPLV